MILLLPARGEATNRWMFAVFGAGLVGSAIVEALRRSRSYRCVPVAFDWSDAEARGAQLQRIERDLERAIEGIASGCGDGRLGVVWSAGKAGFAATPDEIQGELTSFQEVVEMARRLAAERSADVVTFTMISSAGGLFEGQRLVDRTSIPAPRRPYGRLKQRQERILEERGGRVVPRIYRLTSVYGQVAPGRRRGLLTAMIVNGIRRQVTRLSGRLDTLRDYVFAEDVAQFIVRDLDSPSADRSSAPLLLASTKSSSIHEMQRIVEQVLGRRIYVAFDLDRQNSEDITFSPRAVPAEWRSSDLASNARRIYLRALSSGAAFDSPGSS